MITVNNKKCHNFKNFHVVSNNRKLSNSTINDKPFEITAKKNKRRLYSSNTVSTKHTQNNNREVIIVSSRELD